MVRAVLPRPNAHLAVQVEDRLEIGNGVVDTEGIAEIRDRLRELTAGELIKAAWK